MCLSASLKTMQTSTQEHQSKPSFSPRKSALSSCGFSVSQANIFTMRKACAGRLGKRQSGEQNLKETDGSVSDSQM